MAKSVSIRDIVYSDLPYMSAPLANGSGDAVFYDVDDATIENGGQLRAGVTSYGANGVKYTGSMTEKSAQTYTPGTSDQTINANQYLVGAQTIKGDSNLVGANIVDGVSIFGVPGSVKVPVIVQDPTTHGLRIS